MKYKAVPDNEWQQPIRKGYKMMCCDCSLVHVMDFRIIRNKRGAHIQFRADRAVRATAAARRGKFIIIGKPEKIKRWRRRYKI